MQLANVHPGVFPPPQVMLLGLTGTGKSELINRMLDRPAAATSAFGDATKRVRVVKGRVHGVEWQFIDTPGLHAASGAAQRNATLLQVRFKAGGFLARVCLLQARCRRRSSVLAAVRHGLEAPHALSYICLTLSALLMSFDNGDYVTHLTHLLSSMSRPAGRAPRVQLAQARLCVVRRPPGRPPGRPGRDGRLGSRHKGGGSWRGGSLLSANSVHACEFTLALLRTNPMNACALVVATRLADRPGGSEWLARACLRSTHVHTRTAPDTSARHHTLTHVCSAQLFFLTHRSFFPRADAGQGDVVKGVGGADARARGAPRLRRPVPGARQPAPQHPAEFAAAGEEIQAA